MTHDKAGIDDNRDENIFNTVKKKMETNFRINCKKKMMEEGYEMKIRKRVTKFPSFKLIIPKILTSDVM